MNGVQFRQWLHEFAGVGVTLSRNSTRPLIMGVLNVTPDSFSDGGNFLDLNCALMRAQEMIKDGVDIIDIGGESSRPGAVAVSAAEELARVLPVIEGIRAISDICISIDTYKTTVMQACVEAGANLINDIKALTEPGAKATVARLQVPVCLMHMQGLPESMQDNPCYQYDIIDQLNNFFIARIDSCVQAGILREQLIIDPGFGFGKSVRHNLMIVRKISEFKRHNLAILLGVSRKSTIGAILGLDINARLSGSIALSVFAMMQGVSIIRSHDIIATKQSLDMIHAISCLV